MPDKLIRVSLEKPNKTRLKLKEIKKGQVRVQKKLKGKLKGNNQSPPEPAAYCTSTRISQEKETLPGKKATYTSRVPSSSHAHAPAWTPTMLVVPYSSPWRVPGDTTRSWQTASQDHSLPAKKQINHR